MIFPSLEISQPSEPICGRSQFICALNKKKSWVQLRISGLVYILFPMGLAISGLILWPVEIVFV